MKKIKLLTNVFIVISLVIYVAGCILASFYMGTLAFIFSVLVPSICLVTIFSIGLYQLYQVHVNDKIEEIKRSSKIEQLDLEIFHRSEFIDIHDAKLKQGKKHKKRGFIYLFEREDGILKIGRAYNPVKRLREHKNDYQQDFKPIALWFSSNVFKEEELVLRNTMEYKYEELNRNELRKCCPYFMLDNICEILKRGTINDFLELK